MAVPTHFRNEVLRLLGYEPPGFGAFPPTGFSDSATRSHSPLCATSPVLEISPWDRIKIGYSDSTPNALPFSWRLSTVDFERHVKRTHSIPYISNWILIGGSDLADGRLMNENPSLRKDRVGFRLALQAYGRIRLRTVPNEIRRRLVHTPRYEVWKERLQAATKARGRKAELARWMAAERGQDPLVWQANISRILCTKKLINAEDLLAITEWMDKHP